MNKEKVGSGEGCPGQNDPKCAQTNDGKVHTKRLVSGCEDKFYDSHD